MRLPAPASSNRSVFRRFQFRFLQAALVTLLTVMFPAFVRAQTAPPKPALITQPIEESKLTVLRGNTYPLALAKYDRGAAPASLPMQRMLLVLKRSPGVEASLVALLDQQQDKSSPNYHAWLTPEQFGQQFGPADADIQAITSWLQLQGFQVAKVSNGRTVIEFSGTAAQVQNAFHTEIHKYSVNGADHWANASDPQIPTALVPAVAGVLTLHNFPRHAMNHVTGVLSKSKATGKSKPLGPLFTFSGQCTASGNCFGLGPYDFATIYNVLPLWTATPAVDGTGQSIAIVGETTIDVQDIRAFRNLFGLPANDPQIIYDGPPPDKIEDEEVESDLDLEWSGAIARGATIEFVTAASTNTTAGVDLSAERIVDNNLAPILSESYGECEPGLGTAGNLFFSQLWQQAAAEGITVFLSTGDSASAGCDRFQGIAPQAAQFGLQVSGFASTPYNVAVGGTDFNDIANPTSYWNLTNVANTQASVKGYIPETTWNDSCTSAALANFGFTGTPENNCNNSQLSFVVWTNGGSGGKSSCTSGDGMDVTSCSGGYAKPSWQAGPGVPNDGKRDIPDVSLFASGGFYTGSFYIVCDADQTNGIYCDQNPLSLEFLAVGGTSASTPSFAGIMALVNQETQARQGNANYVFYKLAAQQSAAGCNSSAGPMNTCVFNDVTSGTIAVPCNTGSLNCNTQSAGHPFGVLSGYNTTTSYDLATGLGSVNAQNLVSKWSSVVFHPSTTSLTLNGGAAVNVTHGTSVSIGVSVSPNSPQATGDVSLIAAQGTNPNAFTMLTLSNGAATGNTNMLPGGTAYSVHAHYEGDGTYGASDSSPVAVTVKPEASKTGVEVITFDLATGTVTNSNATSFPYGSVVDLRVDIMNTSTNTCFSSATESIVYGCPTGSVSLTDNGNILSSGTFVLNSQASLDLQGIQFTSGSHGLAGSYTGDNSYMPSSATDAVTVTPEITLTSKEIVPQTVAIGTPFNIYFMSRANDIGAYATPMSGTYTLFDGTTQVPSTVTLSTGYIFAPPPSTYFYSTLSANILATASGPPGLHNFTAHYSGDSNYASSTSEIVPVNVVYSTNTTISSSAPTVQAGQSVTFTAKVLPGQAGGPALTGSIQFLANQTNLGSPVALVSGQAQFTTSSLAYGNVGIIAAYSGDANYAQSEQGLVEVVTPIASATAIAPSSSSIQQGQNATFTATVTPSPTGGPTPTGIVMFLVNGAGTGGGNISLNASGQAVLSSTTLPLGSVTITGNYLGDFAHSPSSGTVTVTVNAAPDFSVAANPASITVASPGQSGSTMLTLTAMNGLTGTFTLTPQCTALPSESSCSVSPASVTFSSTMTTAAVMLTVSTRAPSSAPATRRFQPTNSRPGTIFAMGLFALLSLLGLRRGRRGIQVAFTVITFAALLTFAACGGGSGGGGGGVHDPGTPVGVDPNASVSFTIGTATHAVPISINVQ